MSGSVIAIWPNDSPALLTRTSVMLAERPPSDFGVVMEAVLVLNPSLSMAMPVRLNVQPAIFRLSLSMAPANETWPPE